MSVGDENYRNGVSISLSLAEGLDGIRQKGWEGSVKVSLQVDKNETLEYVQTPEGEWQLFGGASSSRPKRFSNLAELDEYVKELKPQAATMMPRKPMVYLTGHKSGRQSIRLIEVEAISKLIGENSFAAFQKCFIGADRLRSLFHFHSLTFKQAIEGSPALMRDFNVVLVLLIGTLHELGYALRDLFSSKVFEKIGEESVKTRLKYFGRKWLDHPVAKRIRDQAGHHLGELRAYKQGLAAYTKTAIDIDWQVSEGQGRYCYHSVGAWDMLWLGLSSPMDAKPEIEQEQLNAFVLESLEDPDDFHQTLADAFVEVLQKYGVPIEREFRE